MKAVLLASAALAAVALWSPVSAQMPTPVPIPGGPPAVNPRQPQTIAPTNPLRLMTPDVFNAAGLGKLSPTELATLANWVSLYTRYVVQTGVGSSGVIETAIDGEFKGWEGDTIYKMRNGQIWQQSSYHYHYHYAYDPEVLIYSSGGGFKIHVKDDDDEDVSVHRLK